MFLFISKYGDKIQDASIREFVQEAATFAAKKIGNEARWGDAIKKDLIDRVSAIKVVTAYSSGHFEADKIEKIYAHLQMSDDQKYVNSMMEIELNFLREELELKQSEIRRLLDWTYRSSHEFKYSPIVDDTLCELNHSNLCLKSNIKFLISVIRVEYLRYPFYHYQRPRFFNSAAVGYLLFETLNKALLGYLETVKIKKNQCLLNSIERLLPEI